MRRRMRLIAPSYRLFRRATVSLDTGRGAGGPGETLGLWHRSRIPALYSRQIVPEQSPYVDPWQLSVMSETLMWRPREQAIASAAGASSRRLQYLSKNQVDFGCFSRMSVKSTIGGNCHRKNALAPEVARHQRVHDRATFAFDSRRLQFPRCARSLSAAVSGRSASAFGLALPARLPPPPFPSLRSVTVGGGVRQVGFGLRPRPGDRSMM
jgi:hypothetical protein